MPSDLLSDLFTTPAMRRILSDANRISAMLAFEAALATAEADNGVIPLEAANTIQTACDTFQADIAALAAATRSAGNPAIPFVKALTSHCDEPGRGFVHYGATSQDLIDSASALVCREAVDLIEQEILRLGDALETLAEAHRETPMAGRTLLQPALPITFGFKVAGWLDMVTRSKAAIRHAANEALTLQFGGAVGTLASIGPAAQTVRMALAARLNLPLPAVTTHTARDRVVRLGSELTILAGALAKIATDIALMMQAEIGEASEPAGPGRGGSSTMPHKRNPVAAPAVRAAAMRANGLQATLLSALVQEHERGAGGWHAEWTALPELFDCLSGALSHMAEAAEGLEVRPERMRANLGIASGAMMSEALMMALAPEIGRHTAHHLVQELARQAIETARPLAEIVRENDTVTGILSAGEIAAALDPLSYLGLSDAAVDMAVSSWRAHRI